MRTNSPTSSSSRDAVGTGSNNAQRGAIAARIWTCVFIAGAIASAVFIMYLGRGMTFFLDDWNFVVSRRGGGLAPWLASHNGHLHLTTIAIYKALFGLAGSNYVWYRGAVMLLHVLAGLIVFLIARRQLPGPLATAIASVVLLLGSGSQNILWAFQIGFVGTMAAGLGVLYLLREDGSRDRAASVLLLVALVSSGVGVAFTAGVVTELALVRAWRRLVHIVAGPAVLYMGWSLAYGQNRVGLHDIGGSATYMFRAAAWAASALGGLPFGAGVGIVIVIVLGLLVLRDVGRASPRMAGVLATMLSFWALTAVSRGQVVDPGVSRYVYVGAILILVLIVEMLGAFPVRRGTIAVPAIFVVAIAAACAGVPALLHHAGALRGVSTRVRAELTVVELGAGWMSRALVVDRIYAPQLHAGGYLDAKQDLGSVAMSIRKLVTAAPADRTAADQLLARALTPVATQWPSGDAAPSVQSSAAMTTLGKCVRIEAPGRTSTEITLDRGVAVRASSPVALAVRRFGDEFISSHTLAAGSWHSFDVSDGRARPAVALASADAPIEVCSAIGPVTFGGRGRPRREGWIDA